MILDGDLQRDWKPGRTRESRLVFIGRELNENELRTGLRGLRGLIPRVMLGLAPSISETRRLRASDRTGRVCAPAPPENDGGVSSSSKLR